MLNKSAVKKKKTLKVLKQDGQKHGLKNIDELENDYNIILGIIKEPLSKSFIDIVQSKDIKYFIEYNQLDYHIFKMTIKHRREVLFEELIVSQYKFNLNTMLIELYDIVKEGNKNDEDAFSDEDFMYMIHWENGRLLDREKIKLDFYYFLISQKYEVAIELLKQDYCQSLREDLNDVLIDIQDSFLKKILISQELAIDCLKLALERNLDGIASEIMNNSNLFLDEDILEIAVRHNCEIYLEQSWQNNLKFGNVNNFFAPKVPFSKYVEYMIAYERFDMANDSIKFWNDTYKQENVFEVLVDKGIEELAAILIERAAEMNFRIEFSSEMFQIIVKNYYILLKAIIGKPMYKKYLTDESIQQYLIDPLRKGQTILAAIECYNMIEDHLLMIKHIEHSCKVLIEFSRAPKQFTYCKYPLLLCCLICEFMTKLQMRFPVYESLFTKIYIIYHKAGRLFTERIKDEATLTYHLSIKDLRSRTTLQIISENRLHEVLQVDEVENAIEKNWSGGVILYGIFDMSSFNILMNFSLDDEFMQFQNVSVRLNEGRSFYFNYYSYRDIVQIRFLFKEAYSVLLVILFQFLIYFTVATPATSLNLYGSFTGEYLFLNNLCMVLSLLMFLNKINSMIFFTFVKRWYMEEDSLSIDVLYLIVLCFHYFDLKTQFISTNDFMNNNLASAIIISILIGILWFKVIYSLRVTQTYGGFLRVVYVILSQILNFMLIFFSFCAMCSGIFTLLFSQNSNYFGGFFLSFIWLFSASCNNYTIAQFKYENILTSTFFAIFIVVSILMLINLLIAFLSDLYGDFQDKINSEQRSVLIKVYEYLKFDENYGIFKFLFAPFSLFSIPFQIILIFMEEKDYWNEVFCKILYIFISLIYFIGFLFMNFFLLPIGYIVLMFKVFKSGNNQKLKKFSFLTLFGLPAMVLYYLYDIYNFWYFTYRCQVAPDSLSEDAKNNIAKVKMLFSNLLPLISEKIIKEKKRKQFPVSELILSWLNKFQSSPEKKRGSCLNINHKKTILLNKFSNERSSSNVTPTISYSRTVSRSHFKILANEEIKITFLTHYGFIIGFLQKFADRQGEIEKDLAKNIFPKKHYYDDEYYEYLYYFQDKIFRKLITELTYKGNEKKKELIQLNRVHQDLNKIVDKFKITKFSLGMMSSSNLAILNTGIGLVNKIFAILENNLLDMQANQIFSQMVAKGVQATGGNENYNPGSQMGATTILNG